MRQESKAVYLREPGALAALGAAALGAIAIGALAIGAVAIGKLAIGRARMGRVEVDELIVRRLRIIEALEVPPNTDPEKLGVREPLRSRPASPTEC